MTRRLHTCTAGGTGYLEYLIVFSLIGVVVAVGAHIYGEQTRGKFADDAAQVSDDVAPTQAAPAAQASAPAVPTGDAAVPALFDWRRVVDFLVAAPLVLMLLGGLRGWRRARRQRRRAQRERERADRLRRVVAGCDSALAGGDVVADEQVAQVVAVHAGGARGARDVAAVAVD